MMNRRDFLKRSYYASLGAIVIRYLHADDVQANERIGQASIPRPSQAGKQLYEGHLKVTGKKIYAIDFRAKDLAGWPAIERRHVVLRANRTDRVFLGLRTQALQSDLGVTGMVTGDDVDRW